MPLVVNETKESNDDSSKKLSHAEQVQRIATILTAVLIPKKSNQFAGFTYCDEAQWTSYNNKLTSVGSTFTQNSESKPESIFKCTIIPVLARWRAALDRVSQLNYFYAQLSKLTGIEWSKINYQYWTGHREERTLRKHGDFVILVKDQQALLDSLFVLLSDLKKDDYDKNIKLYKELIYSYGGPKPQQIIDLLSPHQDESLSRVVASYCYFDFRYNS